MRFTWKGEPLTQRIKVKLLVVFLNLGMAIYSAFEMINYALRLSWNWANYHSIDIVCRKILGYSGPILYANELLICIIGFIYFLVATEFLIKYWM